MNVQDNWKLIEYSGQEEMEKWRYCRGCKYLSSAGHWGCCDYILYTDKRRPCGIGKDCTVREYDKGYVPPQRHIEWCKKVDERLEAERREEERRQAERRAMILAALNAPPVELDYIDDGQKKRGRPRTWDYEYAFYLYCHGYYIAEIREILNIPERINLQEIVTNEWRDKLPPGVQFKRHNIPLERQKYMVYKSQKECG